MENESPGYKPTADPKTCLSRVSTLTDYIDFNINSQSLNDLKSLLKSVYRAEENISKVLKRQLGDPLTRHELKSNLKYLLGRRNNITNKSIELLWAEAGTPRLFPNPQPIPLYSS